jgi:sec-independent protein translocase protein TatA
MGNLGPMELVLIALVALLLFGAGRIASVGKGMGQAIKQFKEVFATIRRRPRRRPERRGVMPRALASAEIHGRHALERLTDEAVEQVLAGRRVVPADAYREGLRARVRPLPARGDFRHA